MKYKSDKAALKDVLRLSRLMSYKGALAGLPYGGAKAVILEPSGKYSREKILEAYAVELNKLKDIFVTGTDIGFTKSDLDILNKKTTNLVGFSVNPEKATAYGVMLSLKEALKHIYGNSDYKNVSYAIQGVGKVGGELLSMLVKKGVKNIYIADINKEIIDEIYKKYPFVKIVSSDKIHSQKVEVYCPCAVSNALNDTTIKELKCSIIAGSANNQLKSIEIGKSLHHLGILYCPDYLVNAGGLIAVTDSYNNKRPNKSRLNNKLKNIGKRMDKILLLSKLEKKAPVLIAEEMAESLFRKYD
jgi:glutamate dehydrogenase/leucine dehydrogenase